MSASLFNKSVLFWIKPANTKLNTQRKEKLQGSDFMQKPKPKSSNVYFKIFASGKFFKRGNWHILDNFCFTCPKLGALPPLDLHLFPSGKGSCTSVWDWVVPSCPSEHLLTTGVREWQDCCSSSNNYQHQKKLPGMSNSVSMFDFQIR